jgi:hypothetical protein
VIHDRLQVGYCSRGNKSSDSLEFLDQQRDYQLKNNFFIESDSWSSKERANKESTVPDFWKSQNWRKERNMPNIIKSNFFYKSVKNSLIRFKYKFVSKLSVCATWATGCLVERNAGGPDAEISGSQKNIFLARIWHYNARRRIQNTRKRGDEFILMKVCIATRAHPQGQLLWWLSWSLRRLVALTASNKQSTGKQTTLVSSLFQKDYKYMFKNN